jgi:S-DNA-T family DNA segregation ATPase FtsK/SpoIIIE
VDYFAFDELPHLEGGIIDDQDRAIARLEALVAEMDRRYALFKSARVSNLAAYNVKAGADERLPAYWVVHDEFAEWMLTEEYKSSVTSTVGRLGVKARAAGIYLIFAAQRPDANVVPVQLRSQLGNRLILKVDSEGTSEISLGERGAERLLGRGHMLARLEGEPELVYAQAPFASEGFIDEVVQAIRREHPGEVV